jgi:N-acetylglucosamine kinase-like BadF-type ATPase
MCSMTRATSSAGYALGVDGGGSKTLAVLVDRDGRVRGEGEAGSSNHLVIGWPRAARNLLDAVSGALETAGEVLPVEMAWIGVAGLERQHDIATWARRLDGKHLAAVTYLGNDADLLLGGLADAVGVALIAGTGSNAIGRDGTGAMARAGGWGHLIGDEGSGFDLGCQALRAALRAADGRGPQTVLLERILEAWSATTPDGLLPLVYRQFEKARIAHLSTLVLAAAREGDAPARAIVGRAAEDLALAALTVARKLSFGDQSVPLALGGGLFAHERDFRARVLRALRRRRSFAPVVVVERPALAAARAACGLAEQRPTTVVRL